MEKEQKEKWDASWTKKIKTDSTKCLNQMQNTRHKNFIKQLILFFCIVYILECESPIITRKWVFRKLLFNNIGVSLVETILDLFFNAREPPLYK